MDVLNREARAMRALIAALMGQGSHLDADGCERKELVVRFLEESDPLGQVAGRFVPVGRVHALRTQAGGGGSSFNLRASVTRGKQELQHLPQKKAEGVALRGDWSVNIGAWDGFTTISPSFVVWLHSRRLSGSR